MAPAGGKIENSANRETQGGTRCERGGWVPGIGDAGGDPVPQEDITEQATAEAGDASAAQDANRIQPTAASRGTAGEAGVGDGDEVEGLVDGGGA